MTVMLVLIEHDKKRYSRYSGRTLVNQIIAEDYLSAHWVELFRVRPEEVLPEPDPEYA